MFEGYNEYLKVTLILQPKVLHRHAFEACDPPQRTNGNDAAIENNYWTVIFKHNFSEIIKRLNY